ncbi:DUF6603 domain-containing protein [Kitasatospora sp. NPDC056446]|uniref:DUF6603 domain-containing protein n=1 Tax=Kitasatospora sp. NPDC056446 TaxID=3345819 RepID=UPI0036AF12F9
MAERMKLLLKGRGGYPFADPLVNRNPDDLDQPQPAGGIKLARHHVIPFETLVKSWNAAVENGYNKSPGLRAALVKFVDTVVDKLETLDYTDQEKLNFPRIREFAETFRDPGSEFGDDGITPEGLDDIHSILTWLPGNLFVGPDNQNRTDDPGPKVESGSARIIGQETLAKRTAAFGSLDKFSKKPKGGGMEEDGVQGFKGLVEAFTPNRLWPLKNADWEKVGAKYRVRPVGVLAGTAAEPSAPAPEPGLPQEVDFVVIGGIRLDLDIWSDESGYRFRGVTAENIRMADLLDWFGENWGVAGEIPEGLRSFDLQYLTIEVLTIPGGSEEWEFTAATEVRLGGTVMDLLVGFRRSTPAGGGASTFSLSADAGFTAAVEGAEARLWFSGAIARTGSGVWELAASLESEGQALTLGHLAAAFGIDVPADLEPFVPSFGSVSFVYRLPVGTAAPGSLVVSAVVGRVGVVVASVPDGTGPGVARLVAVRGAVGARASDLPLVGESIPADLDVVVTGVNFCYPDRVWPVAQVRALNAVVAGLPGAAQGLLPVLLDEALQRGLLVWGLLTMGGQALPPLVRRPGGTGAAALAQGGTDEPVPPDTSGGAVVLGHERAVVAGRQRGDSAQELDQVFGPVRIRRVSLGYAKGRLFVAFDATVAVGPLVVDLVGLGLGIDKDFGVFPVLQGAAVEMVYKGPPRVEIAGAFVRLDLGPDFDVAMAGAGRVDIQNLFALQVAGSWARNREGWTSLFAYAELVAGRTSVNGLFAIGPVTVTGIALGFGINSTVRIPTVTDIQTFPLVKRLGTAPSTPGDEVPPLTPGQALAELVGPGGWVTPAQGRYWIAGGVQFTVYKFIEARVLALVEWGQGGWKAMLAGSTTLSLPPTVPGKDSREAPSLPDAGTALASIGSMGQVIVDFVFVYDSALGRFSMDAVIAKGSYILDPAAELTGGISLYVWGKDLPEQGIGKGFVLSAGGYHPRFRLPAYYPRPPRIGMVWERGPVTLKAQAYAALTDGAFMIGGSFAAVYDQGHNIQLQAWFTAHLDALVQWKPFYADLALGLSIGVAATVKVLFVRVRVSLEVGVSLQLWLPPIGGRAKVKVWFISFTIGFGADRQGPPPIPWEQFRIQLPAPLRTAPKDGCTLPDVTAGESEARAAAGAPQLMRMDGFTVAVESAVPASKITVDGKLFAGSEDARVDIRPMRLAGVVSEQRVRLLDPQGESHDVTYWEAAGWKITAVRDGLPQALWGKPLARPDQALGQPGLVAGCLTGLSLTVPPPKLGPSVGPVSAAALDVEPVLPPGNTPLRDTAVAGKSPVPGSVAAITGTLTQTATTRTKVHQALAALGAAPGSDGPLDRYAVLAGRTLTDPPLLTAPGTR